MKILITGVGGSGKTTLIEELLKKGNIAIDLDDTDLCFWINKNTGEKIEYTEGAGFQWLENHSWRLDIEQLQKFIENFPPTENIYLGGKIAKSQLKEVCKLFDKVFLLRPSDSVLIHRQNTRTNKENKFAQDKKEQEHILEKRRDFEDECLKKGAILIDADKPVQEILKEVILTL